MIYKVIGIVFIIAGCGGVGFCIASAHRQEMRTLHELADILDFMVCELTQRRTPLPQLCRMCAKDFPKLPGMVFHEFAIEMESQIFPDLSQCMTKTLDNFKDIPPITRRYLQDLGRNIGRFDLDGQIKGLTSVKQECMRELAVLNDHKEARLRSYQTLGLCAGAALAILLV